MKLKHIALIGSLFPILFSIVLFFGVLISADSDDENSNFSSGITGMNLSAEVLKHQPMVEKYARENGISEYVNVLLAIIQVESGGTAEDVMQSSESLGLPPNSLDTESSIKQGCKYFASLLSSCQNQGIDDLNVAIQSYNYGGGYVGYVAGKGKKHTFNLAENFAREKSGGKKVTYTNPIAVAKNGGWRYGYGNMFYVELVNQYLTVSQVSGELAQKVMNEALKYQGWKYVYGGSNPNTSFDCSGLTQWCYGKAGISLPRTAQAQYDATQHLPLSQANADKMPINAGKTLVNSLSTQQNSIIQFAKETGSIKSRQVEELLGVKQRRARRILGELVNMGILERQGAYKSTVYVLKN